MVAEQADAMIGGRPWREQPFDHVAGKRATVDVVAEIELDALPGRVCGDVGANRLMHGKEEIEPAMDVADGVDAKSFGKRGAHGIGMSWANFGT
jgi:hypothetical protein